MLLADILGLENWVANLEFLMDTPVFFQPILQTALWNKFVDCFSIDFSALKEDT